MTKEFASRLTTRAVDSAKPTEKIRKLSDGGGLYLEITPSGGRYWRYKFRLNGVEGRHAIGTFPGTSLSRARELHAAARALVSEGRNPNHARQEAAQQAQQAQQREALGTLAAVITAWRALTDPELRPTSLAQRGREIKREILPTLGARPVESITRLEIAALLRTIAERAPETARNVRTHLSAAMEHAIDSGLLEANPVPPRSILGKRRQTSHAAMAIDRMGPFLRVLDSARITRSTRAAMLLTMLCASRKTEVTSAMWKEFDLEAATWTIPAERMKGARAHVVPLPTQAVALLSELHEGVRGWDLLVFPNRRERTRPMAGNSLNAFMVRSGYGEGATPHGMRSQFSSWANQRGANPDVIERCLAHVHGDAVRAAYNRADYMPQRRELMQQWADHLDGLRNSVAE